MPTITYSTKYRKNEGLILSAEELLALYFYGINLKTKDGSIISNEVLRTFIRTAQEEVEKYLGVRVQRKLVEHNVDYYTDDHWTKFPIVSVKLPVEKALSMIGLLGTTQQIVYPQEWLHAKADSEGNYNKSFTIVPVGSSMGISGTSDIMYTGLLAQRGLQGYRQVPNYFTVQYITGFKAMPYDLMNVIGKMASINLFNLLGDIILGAGIASTSLGIDGLSQSVATTSSAENSGYSARTKAYQKEIKETLVRLKQFYKKDILTAL